MPIFSNYYLQSNSSTLRFVFCNVTFCFYHLLDGPISACQRTAGGKDYVNLGYAHSNPTVVSEGIIHLHYVNGMFPAY